MRDEGNYQNMYKYLFLFLILVIILAIALIFTLNTQGVRCTNNPINYGLKQLDKYYDTHSQAVVSLNKLNYVSWIATADKNTPIQLGGVDLQPSFPNFNFTNIQS